MGYSITTAEFLYRIPDSPGLVQTFVWTFNDWYPEFPVLLDFCDFWRENIDGPLVEVTVAHRDLLTRGEVRLVNGVYRMN